MPIFGDDSAGATSTPGSDGRALVSKFTLTEAGDVTKISAYVAARSGAGASWKGLILADSSGTPSTVSAVTAGATVDAVGWMDLTFGSPVTLAAGTYWIGTVANSFEGDIGADSTPGTTNSLMANGTFSYSSPPGTWPGTDASYETNYNVYATYEAGPTLSAAGVNSITSTTAIPKVTITF